VSVSVSLDFGLFDTTCLRGRAERYVVYDSTGASGGTQHLDVAYGSRYSSVFPNDVIAHISCNEAGGYGQPVFFMVRRLLNCWR
jgi:hypothetical protein